MWSYLLVLVFAALASSAIPPRKQLYLDLSQDTPIKPFTDPIDGISYRLSNDTYPLHYDVSLKTDVHSGDFSFTGKVDILFEVRQSTFQITLHSRQLTIIKIDLFDLSGVSVQEDCPFSEDPLTEFLTIPAPKILAIGEQYKLIIDYSGILREDEAGFYRSSYVNAQGEPVWLATTQFESTDARHGFPCWDEPAIRSTFSIEIEHHQSYNALSNMPVLSRNLITADHVLTKFATTPKIQTYLIAYVVSNFVSVDDLEAKKQQRVFATPAQIADGQGDFALDFGVKNLEAFEKYLGVDYLLPKIDQISIPDFAAGAMENFGLVTYWENYLLYNNVTHTAVRKFDVAETVSHEYAHQWFGNHVSPAWWSYLWLNEGFATLFESYATGLVYPEWREMEMFVIGTLHSVFQTDALNPRAMTHYVESPENIDNLFDRVAYSKSGAVLRMLQTLMTEEVFAKGLQIYLDEFVEKAATPEDLYRSLQTAIDGELLEQTPNIAAFMRTWELQAGFPVIHVSRNGDEIMIEQERYFLNSQADEAISIWSIPLNYMVASNPDYSKTTMDFWMTEKTYTLTNAEAPKKWTANDWILFNIQETGYYRVNYDMNLWKLLSDELTTGDHKKFHPTNRAQLIDDSFDLARSQRLPYSVPLDILSYLKVEDDYIPWAATNRALNILHPYLIGSTEYPLFQQLMRENVELFYNRLGTSSKPTDTFLDKFARNIAINWACMMGNVQCLAETSAMITQVSNGVLNIEPDLETTIYCNGMRTVDQLVVSDLMNSLRDPINAFKKPLIMNSVGFISDPLRLNFYLEASISPEYPFSSAECIRIIQTVYTNGRSAGIDLVLQFVLDFHHDIVNKISNVQLTNIVRNLASRVSNQLQFNNLVEVMTTLRTASLLDEENQNDFLVTASNRIAWVATNVVPIEVWLREHFNVDPQVTEAPTSTVTVPEATNPPTSTVAAPETTTNGSGTIFISGFALFTAIFVKFM